jgi:hypothetical protein
VPEKTSAQSVGKNAWILYKQEAKKVLPTSFNFLMVFVAVMAVGLFYPLSLLVSVPFVLLPFFFAYQMSVSYLRKGSSITNRQFYAYFLSYFQMPFYGCYRVLLNFLFSLLYALGAAFVVALVYYGVAGSLDSAFISAVNELSKDISNGSIDAANTLLSNNAALLLFQQAVSIAEYTVLFLSFVAYLSFWGLSPYVRAVIEGAPARVCNAIFQGSLRLDKKAFRKDFVTSLWPGLLLEIVGYGAGAFVASLYWKDPLNWMAGGIAGAGLLLMPFFPYYFHVAGLLMEKYRGTFAEYSIKLAQDTLKQLEDAKKLSEAEAEELKKNIEDAKKVQEDNPELLSPDEREEDEKNKKDGGNDDE